MKRYQHIVVPLSLESGDQSIVEWASKLSRMSQAKRVSFVHPVEELEIPSSAKEKYPWLSKPLTSQIESELKERVLNHWNGHEGTDLSFVVLESSAPIMSILKFVKEEESDLVLVQRATFGHDLAVRLARKAPCSVLMIPGGAEAIISRILVCNDFSSHAENAMDLATAFATEDGLDEVTSLHVSDVGPLARRATIPLEQLEQMQLDYLKEEHIKAVENSITRDITVRGIEWLKPTLAPAVLRASRESGYDFIIIGSRGKDTAAALLLGSNAEELMRHSSVPVLTAKLKGAGLSLLEALLK